MLCESAFEHENLLHKQHIWWCHNDRHGVIITSSMLHLSPKLSLS